ncbi:MAG: hypothetical protein WD449_02460 [Candidatus Babeliales bacterium]
MQLLLQFLAQPFPRDTNAVFAFKGAVYPYLMFPLLIRPWALRYGAIQVLAAISTSFASIQGQLSQTFLGQQSTFWLGSLDELSKHDYDQLIKYLEQYEGPHRVLFYTANELKLAHGQTIEIPQKLSMQDAYSLVQGDEQFQLRVKTFINAIYKQVGECTIDQACLMVQYGALIGRHHTHFIQEWLAKIIPGEASLFTLSTYFFARKPSLFYKEWLLIKDNYPDVFWIIYWSEQVWRASYYIQLRGNNFVAAKRIAYRLPFSFINNDWKKIAPVELMQAHSELYQIDCDVKNGATAPLLEVWFTGWFL